MELTMHIDWAEFKRTLIALVIVLLIGAGIAWLALGPDGDHPTNWLDPVLHPDVPADSQ
jgi:hypothetical protein